MSGKEMGSIHPRPRKVRLLGEEDKVVHVEPVDCVESPASPSSSNDESDYDENGACEIFRLPSVVWSVIFSFLSQEECATHRLICRRWRDLVDSSSTLNIRYNALKPEALPFVLSRRVRECEFSGIKESLLPFGNPMLLRKVTLGASISPENTTQILQSFKNLECLKYYATEKSDTAFTVAHQDFLKALRKLKSVEIGMLFFCRSRIPSTISSCVSVLLGDSMSYHCLQELTVNVEFTRGEWDMFYSFVTRHAGKLSKFSFFGSCVCEYDDTVPYTDSSFLQKVECFQLCTLKTFSLLKGGVCKCRCMGELLWSSILKNQCQVESLFTDLVPETQVIKEFAQNNQKSLGRLVLQDISLGVDAYMDLSVFQSCRRLQQLSLTFTSSSVIVMNWDAPNGNKGNQQNWKGFTEKFSECGGLQFLPKSLHSLSIKGCDAMSSTLLEMCSSLPLLNELSLGEPGSPQRLEYGVTTLVLLEVVKNMQDLRSLCLHRNFLRMNNNQVKEMVDIARESESLNTSESNIYHFNLSGTLREKLLDLLGSV